MDYISDFCQAVQSGIRQSKKSLQLFFTDMAILHKKTGSFFKRSSILKTLVKYTDNQVGFIDIISPFEQKTIEHHFNDDNYKLDVKKISTPSFTQPLEKLVRFLLIADHKTAYIQPTNSIDTGLYTEDKREVMNFVYIFSQLIQKEQENWYRNILSNYTPKHKTESVIQLGSLPETLIKITSNSSIRDNGYNYLNNQRRQK